MHPPLKSRFIRFINSWQQIECKSSKLFQSTLFSLEDPSCPEKHVFEASASIAFFVSIAFLMLWMHWSRYWFVESSHFAFLINLKSQRAFSSLARCCFLVLAIARISSRYVFANSAGVSLKDSADPSLFWGTWTSSKRFKTCEVFV